MFHPRGPSFVELARQALSSTTRGYDLLAPKFEYTPFRTPDALLEPLSRALAHHGPFAAGLDVCCGTGAAARMLRPLCREHVTGVDLSEGMLEEARCRSEEAAGEAEMRFVRMDALDLAFDEEFDVAVSVGAFGHILEPDQDAFARGVYRALRPGGVFGFITREMPAPGTRAWLFARGFNAAMHIRNALIKPPFIMFYLTFTLERAHDVLERNGFRLEVLAPPPRGEDPRRDDLASSVFDAGIPSFPAMRIVLAFKD